MTQFRVTATLFAPLAIQRTRQTNTPQALPYLPGSTFRGAVAAKYLREGGNPEDETFRAVFVEDPVHFPNLLPVDTEDKVVSQVLPLTSISCKRQPGFKSQNSHGVIDTLAQKFTARYHPAENRQTTCLDCKNDLKAITGFWNGNIKAPAMFHPTMFFQRHTGIDRDTGTVAHEIFFITQAIADWKKGTPGYDFERQLLTGGIDLDERKLAVLEPLLQGSLFAGQDRTRGMGELEITVEPIDAAIPDIEKWSNEFKATIKRFCPPHLLQDLLSGLYFSIKLESHGIFFDEFLRPSSEIELDFSDIELVHKVAKAQVVRGWNDAWRMAKPDDTGVMMGSVYLYKYSGDDVAGLSAYLAALAVSGVGERRTEGFGRILIDDSFHIQREAM